MMPWWTWLGLLAAVLGTGVLTLGTIGVFRLEDARDKLQAGSVMTTLGIPLALCAPLLSGEPELFVRALLVAGFAAFTAPLASHVLADLQRRL